MATAVNFQLVGTLSLAFQKRVEERTVSSDVVVKVSGQTTWLRAQNQEAVVWCCPLVATAEN